MLNQYLIRMLNSRVYDVAHTTDLDYAKRLSHRLQAPIWLKREDQQPVFSFKLRGAYNKMAQLSAAQLAQGVVTASAGNHAQGVALAAHKLNCQALIVVPTTTPQLKINAIQSFGGQNIQILQHGESYSDAYQHAEILAKQQGYHFVHPFDDPDVIAGQGTIGLEILRQSTQPIHAIFVAIGGGGLAAGVSLAIKALQPLTKVIGVQTTDSNAMEQSIQHGERVTLSDVGLFSDGTAVKLVGAHTFAICQQYLDDIVIVNADEICSAIKDVFEDTRTVLEPAGALALAGLKKYVLEAAQNGHALGQNDHCVAVTSGANMNFDRLRFVVERADVGQSKEALFAVTIPEERGSFKKLCHLLGQYNITEFNYRCTDEATASIFIGVTIQSKIDLQNLENLFKNSGFNFLNLSHDELAKSHLRHMIGGRLMGQHEVVPELVYRFEFPERPGALMRFLDHLSPNWNISLFHYRSLGGDAGKILVGIQVPTSDMDEWQRFLDTLNYPYWNETNHLAYQLFLSQAPWSAKPTQPHAPY